MYLGKKLPKEKYHPMTENSPNLVTLILRQKAHNTQGTKNEGKRL
jgi:hypothetical protein